jgi:hypothetical protein
MLILCFSNSPYKAINTLYPNRFKEWELLSTPNSFWNEDNGIKAIKWLLEDKLNLSDEDIKNHYSRDMIIQNGLGGMLAHVFKDRPYEAINIAYPNKFKPWEFKSTPKNYWTKLTAKEATIWLFNEKLKWTKKEISDNLSIRFIRNTELNSPFQLVFKNSLYELMKNAYPEYEWDEFK